jgi:hypothetical protein
MTALFIFCVVTYVVYAIGDVGMDYVWEKSAQKNLANTMTWRDMQQGLDKTHAEFTQNKWATLFAGINLLAINMAYVAACWALFVLTYPKHKFIYDWVKSMLATYL